VIAREITKRFEEFLSFDILQSEEILSGRELKGEVVCLIWIPEKEAEVISEDTLKDKIEALLAEGLHSKEIAKTLSEQYNLPKKEVYSLVKDVKDAVSK